MTRREVSGAGAALAAVGAATLWGTTGTSQALGPDGTNPTSVGAARIVLGALVLVLLAWVDRTRRSGPARRSGGLPTPVLVALGGLAVAAYQACFFLGVARAGVAIGTVITLGIAPLATGLLGLLLGERLGMRWGLATAGAIAGVVLLVVGSGNGSAGGQEIVGVVAALGAGVAYAVYTVAARALLVRGIPGLRVMAWLFVLGAILLAPFLLAADLRWLATPSGVVMVLWLGIAATALSYVLFQYGLARIPAGTVATLSLAEPVTAALLGVVVLREQLSLPAGIGIVVVIVSLLFMAARRRGHPVRNEPVSGTMRT